ncbi:hypothetical protein ACWCQW_51515 [Streptomyces mirabilis]
MTVLVTVCRIALVIGNMAPPCSAGTKERNLSSKQERKTRPPTQQEEETTPDPEQSSASVASAAEASSNAADVVVSIDEVLDEFDDLTLTELGFRKGEVIDHAEIDEAIRNKVMGFRQRGGQ